MTDENERKGFAYEGSGWLTGQFLIAVPGMTDPRFERAVIYLCSHTPSGAMGLIVNKVYGELNFCGLLAQLKITPQETTPEISVHFGGPVETGRGFVLHTADYNREGTVEIDGQMAMTATIEVLQALAIGTGPSHALLALGYAGWGAGQLDAELQTTGWIVAPADTGIIFDPINDTKWERALAKIGVSPTMLSSDAGHA